MSTRSLTIFHSEWDNKPICAMYRQSDGYLSRHGLELKEVFGNIVIVNGIGYAPEGEIQANGMGCLAAQVVAHFKEGIGGIYMQSPTDKQSYNYYLFSKKSDDGKNRLWLTVKYENGKKIFDGWLSELQGNEDDEE